MDKSIIEKDGIGMEKVRVGIIGCGMITARRHAPEYTDNPHSGAG